MVSARTRGIEARHGLAGAGERWGVWGPYRGPHLLKMRQALAIGRRAAPEPPREEVAGEVTSREPEGQRKREHEPPERDAEGDQDHLLADAQMRERGGGSEEQHGPVHGPREQTR